jgi:hypothetical protein
MFLCFDTGESHFISAVKISWLLGFSLVNWSEASILAVTFRDPSTPVGMSLAPVEHTSTLSPLLT